MEVSSGQAGQHHHGTPVTHQSARGEHAGQQVPPGLLAAGGPGPGPSEEPTGAGVRASSSHVTPTPQGCGGPRPGPPPIQPRKPPKSVAPNPPPLRPCPAPQGRKPTPAGPGAVGPNRYSVCTQGVTSGASESLVTVTVQCALTLTLTAPRGADLSSLRALMSQALPRHAQHAQLSYRDPSEHGCWMPLSGEEVLRRVWRDAAGPGGLQLQCRGVGGRPVLYQVVAQHVYSAQRPEDLALQPGDTVDVLCEVDQAWLEGHCDGRVGIFPKSFAGPAARHA